MEDEICSESVRSFTNTRSPSVLCSAGELRAVVFAQGGKDSEIAAEIFGQDKGQS